MVNNFSRLMNKCCSSSKTVIMENLDDHEDNTPEFKRQLPDANENFVVPFVLRDGVINASSLRAWVKKTYKLGDRADDDILLGVDAMSGMAFLLQGQGEEDYEITKGRRAYRGELVREVRIHN